ncbi:MAG: metalloregulator ArsR/SmtB family transcription factor [Acidimicrobiales bacterium]
MTDDAPELVGACCPPLTGTVLDEAQATELAARLKALADPVRLRLISLLACSEEGEICACDLPALLERKQPTVSHHLKVLTEAGLIEREQRGKWAWFQLATNGLDELRVALGEKDRDRDHAPEVGATY